MANVPAWVWSGDSARLLAQNILVSGVTVSATELGYLNGVTSSIQTQLDAKFAAAGGTITGDVTLTTGTATPLTIDAGATASQRILMTGTATAPDLFIEFAKTGGTAQSWLIGLNPSAFSGNVFGIWDGTGGAPAFSIEVSTLQTTLYGPTICSAGLTISTTSNQLVLGTTNTTTISATAPAASRVYTIPDAGGAADFVMTAGAQTIGGAKTFSGAMTIDTSDLTLNGGRLIVKENDQTDDAVIITRDADEGYVNIYSAGALVTSLRGNGDNYINGGNVGIGTDSPTNLFTVLGTNSTLSSGSDSGAVDILGGTTGSGNYTAGIGFGFSVSQSGRVGLCGVQDGGDSDQMGLAFYVHPSATGTDASIEALRISSAGNVGIGTASPASALTIGSQGSFPNSFAFELGNADSQTALCLGERIDATNKRAMRIFANNGTWEIGTNATSAHATSMTGLTYVNAISFTETGSVTLGPSSGFTGIHTMNIGTTGAPINIPASASGAFYFANGLVTTTMPTMMTKTTDNSPALYILGAGSDGNTEGDMRFDVREGDNSSFATTSNLAFRWSHFNTTIGSVTRAGAWTLGPSSGLPIHRINTTTTAGATAGTNGAVPAQVAGYVRININGTDMKIPYFNV